MYLCNEGNIVKRTIFGDYVKDNVPSLKHFISEGNKKQDYNVPSLAALSSAMRLLQRCDCESCGEVSVDLSFLFQLIAKLMYSELVFKFYCYFSLSGGRYEFKSNHGEWVMKVKPDLGPGISERVWEAVRMSDEKVGVCRDVKSEVRSAFTTLLGVFFLSIFLNAQ